MSDNSYQPPTLAEIEQLAELAWLDDVPGEKVDIDFGNPAVSGSAGETSRGDDVERPEIQLCEGWKAKEYKVQSVIHDLRRGDISMFRMLLSVETLAGSSAASPTAAQLEARTIQNLPLYTGQTAVAQALVAPAGVPGGGLAHPLGVFQGIYPTPSPNGNLRIIYVVGQLSPSHQSVTSMGYQARIVWEEGRKFDVIGPQMWRGVSDGRNCRTGVLYDPVLPPLPPTVSYPPRGSTEERVRWGMRAHNAEVRQAIVELWLMATAHWNTGPEPKRPLAPKPS